MFILFNPMTNLQARFNYSFHLMQGKIETPDLLHIVFIASIFSLNVSFETGRSFVFSFH